MNPNFSDHHELEALLRRDAALPPLADDGFSARVLTALPRRRRAAFLSLRTGLCGAGALTGVAFAVARGEPWPTLAELLSRTGEATLRVGAFLAEPAQWLMLLVVVASVVFAFRSGRDSTERGF